MTFGQLADGIGHVIDLAGVLAIAGAIAGATAIGAARLVRRELRVYFRFRQEVGRGILLGLELLVAGDIIRTVAISPSLQSVAVLAGIVLVRTFLSFVLEVELTGRWPWHRVPDGVIEERAGLR
jgi:uncharacterized membrane protein